MGKDASGSPTADNDCPGFRVRDEGEPRSQDRGRDAARFWSRIDRSGAPGSCWTWKAGKSVDAGGTYGWSAEHRQLAHVVAYVLAIKPVPEGWLVRHRCHRPLCCNPAHLVVGTRADNARDSVRDGRTLRGQDHPRAKLTDDQVVEIRRLRALGVTVQQIAKQCGLSSAGAHSAVSGRTWGHVQNKRERARRLATLRLVGDMKKAARP